MAAIWNEEERRKKNKTKIQIYVCRKREAVMHSLSKRHYRHTVYGSFSPVNYSDNFGLFLNLDLKTMRLDYYDEVRYDTLFHVTYLPIFDKPLLPLCIWQFDISQRSLCDSASKTTMPDWYAALDIMRWVILPQPLRSWEEQKINQ